MFGRREMRRVDKHAPSPKPQHVCRRKRQQPGAQHWDRSRGCYVAEWWWVCDQGHRMGRA